MNPVFQKCTDPGTSNDVGGGGVVGVGQTDRLTQANTGRKGHDFATKEQKLTLLFIYFS